MAIWESKILRRTYHPVAKRTRWQKPSQEDGHVCSWIKCKVRVSSCGGGAWIVWWARIAVFRTNGEEKPTAQACTDWSEEAAWWHHLLVTYCAPFRSMMEWQYKMNKWATILIRVRKNCWWWETCVQRFFYFLFFLFLINGFMNHWTDHIVPFSDQYWVNEHGVLWLSLSGWAMITKLYIYISVMYSVERKAWAQQREVMCVNPEHLCTARVGIMQMAIHVNE